MEKIVYIRVYLVYTNEIMETKISKWGNGLAVRIPKHLAKKFKLKEGSRIDLEGNKDHITITPKKKKKTLEWLLDGMGESNRHEILIKGEVGRENCWD